MAILNLYDEGIILTGALRVLNGDIPYKDFWAMYPPGNFYVNAFLFSVFGEYAYLNRLFDAATKLSIAFACYAIFRIYLSSLDALLIFISVLLFLLSVGFPGFPVFQAILLALLMILILIQVDQMGGRGHSGNRVYILLFLLGILNGLMVFFRHDLAAYALLSVLAYLLYPLFRPVWSATKVVNLAKEIVVFAVGVAVIFLPLSTLLLFFAGYGNVDFSLIESPLSIYPANRSLPFPKLSLSFSMLLYFPFIILIFSIFILGWRAVSRRAIDLGSGQYSLRFLIFLILLVSLFSIKGFVRPHVVHFAPAIIVSLILASYLMQLGKWIIVAPLVFLMVMFSFATGTAAASRYFSNAQEFVSSCKQPALPRLFCVSADADTVEAAIFIDENFQEVEYLYAGPGVHDRIFVGNVAAYFIVGKRPASKWHESHPGIQTRADVQIEMILDLMRRES